MSKNKIKKVRAFSPIYTIMLMTGLIMVISFVLSLIGFDAQKAVITASPFGEVPYITEMTLTTVKNALSIEGLKFIISNISTNLNMFSPLITLFMALIAIGIGEASGLFKRVFGFLRNVKLNILLFLTLLISILGAFFGDAIYLLLIPLFAVIYNHAGRNPVLGIITSFIGVTAGYGAGLFMSYNGYLVSGITEIAANLDRNNNFIFDLNSTIFISAFSTLLLAIFGTMTIKRFLLPNISKKVCVVEEEETSKKGLFVAIIMFVIFVVMMVYSVIPGLPFSGALLDNSEKVYIAKLMSPSAPFSQGFIYLLMLAMMIIGFVYGFINQEFKNSHDFNRGLSLGFEKLGYLFVMLFFAFQMIALLEWTNIGEVVSARLIDIVSALQFSGLPLMIAFVILIFLVTLVIPSTLAKWNLIAPIAVPLFMRSNVTPNFTQFMFTSLEGVSKAFTPIYIYFLIMVGFVQKYSDDENITIFGTMRLVMPSLIVMLAIWIMIVLGWYIIGLPLGINIFPTI